jgi:UDP-GlcNAc:undecaprenyl-phosphate GlcNAc-1-phosphate transferase
MYIRHQRGLPVFWGSPDHIAIRLRHWGLSVPQIVVTCCAATAFVGGIGLLIMSVGEDAAWVLCVGTISLLLAVGVLLRKVEVARPSGIVSRSGPVEGQKAA